MWGLIERLPFGRSRPVLAAILASALTLALVGGVVVSTTPLRCGPARALGLKSIVNACTPVGSLALRPRPTPTTGAILFPTISPDGNPASPPNGNPASGPYPPYGNPASGPYPPTGNPASDRYPPFYPPATSGFRAWPLDCRLPVYAGGPGSGGFIVFPGGTFIADPTSNVTTPSPSPGAPTPTPNGPGYGPGFPGLSYDSAYSRWVPVPASWVSPDGSRYAYTASDGIYVVSVASGTQTEVGEGHSWAIVAVQTAGVYANHSGAAGLWLLPFSGTPRQITTAGYWQAATSAAAYGTATSAVPQGATNTILRLDLNTGTNTDWFTRQGTQSSVAGFDGKGHPILYVSYVNGSGNEIWIATGPTNATPIAGYATSPYSQTGFNANGAPVADRHGVWFAGYGNSGNYGGSASGVALYVAGSGLYWMSSIGGQLAGSCS